MRRIALLVLFLSALTISSTAQMLIGNDTLYGNEWINYDQTYYKIMVAQDGMYRIPLSALPADMAGVEANRFQLFYFGEEIPIYTTTEGVMGSGDYIEFYGLRNRGEMDKFLYANPEDQFNPYYSLFTDTSAYFLTWDQDTFGKRFLDVEPDWTDLPEKEAFYWAKMIFTPSLNFPAKNKIPGARNLVERSLFENAEGWCRQNPSNLSLPLSHTFTAFTDSIPITVTYANLDADLPATKTINISGNTSGDFFSLYEGKRNTFLIPSSILNAPPTISITGGNKTGLSCVEMEYPRLFNASGDSIFVFWIKSSDSKTYLEIENFAQNGSAPVLYDIVNETRIPVVLEGSLVKVVLPESSLDRKLVLTNDKGVKSIAPPKQIQFIDYSQSNAEFLIVFNKVIAVDGNGVNQIEAYANYRNNTFITDTFEIQQLYDQFAFGIQRHPMAIKNLVFYAKVNWSNPQYLLLIGKGMEYHAMRSSSNVNTNLHKHFFLPTFGYTGADHLFACPAGSIDPVLSVGRLPVVNADEIRGYLEKVIEFEQAQDPLSGSQTIADKAWMKRVMHLGGGREEKEIIKAYLTGMENTIKNNQFGGIVKAFYNTTSEPVMTSATGEIIQQINNGLSLLTFFGHSSATLLDFNFDDPAAYDNQGKYPVMLSFGCLSGEMYNTSRGLGERFITADKKGMIAFISSPGYGFVSSLNVLGSNYYSKLGGNMYGQSIGNILKESLKILGASTFNGDLMLGEQTSIQGDPSLVLNPLPGPDYLPDPQSVKIYPPLLTTTLDSFQISLDLWNIGYNLPDTTFVLKIEHELPDNSSFTILTDTISAPASMAPVQYSLPVIEDDQALVGVNRFIITVDAADDIEEKPLAAENNNTYIHPVYISSADAEPLYPANFGIINYSPVTLNASTGNPFFPQLTYWMEIDTTELFNSTFKQSTSISQAGGVIKWTPDVALQPKTVYFWRVSPDSSLTGSYRWRYSSFVYLPNSSPGWNQSHYYQFRYGNFVDMKMDSTTRKLAFIDDVVDFKIRNNVKSLYPTKNARYYRNQEVLYIHPDSLHLRYLHYEGQFDDALGGVFVAVIDPVQVKTIAIPPLDAGSHFSRNSKSFMFKTETADFRKKLIDFLENDVLIPDGHYVLLFTCQDTPTSDYKPQDWASDSLLFDGKSIFSVLEAEGATQVRALATSGSLPYNLFFQKGDQDTFLFEKTGDKVSLNELNIAVEGSWTEGSLTSPPIGPSQKWETLDWALSDIESNDDIKLSVWGIRTSGQDTLLYDNVLNAVNPLPLENIDATQIPYLKLHYFAKDPTQKTPPHLEFWRIHYLGVPEAALDPAGHFTLQSDTLLQGAPLLLEVATENLSDYDMDSLLVRYTILNPQNQAANIEHRYRPLPARDTLIAHLHYDTRPTTGVHQLTIDVNPDDDQPEQTHINNVGVLQFFVEKDLRNPLLDVTFDGEHILDGDLVSATPQIQVQLKDENPFLALEDTSLFRLLLLHPDGMEERLYFTDERIRFYPAEVQNGKNNRARVEFNPVFNTDGDYAFYVEAKDVTGNKTGDIDHVISLSTFGYDYKISFKVITESMISNVLNYPNPFSTSTRFLYTLTGSEPPAWFTIQILTVSGRVVREITQHEIGAMKIGTHLTDYAWDGRDEFGDPLANGVYLYRIVAKKANGENFKAFASGADAFFEKGYGKMVIIR